MHCGGCGRACVLDHVAVHACAGSECRPVTCAEGWKDCDGDPENGCERNIRSPRDCGDCGVRCSLPNSSVTCASGSCEVRYCDFGFGDCDGVSSNGCETETRTVVDCGSCGSPCILPYGSGACPGGVCVVDRCDAGRGNCDYYDDNGCEIDLNTDSENCGRCENPCDAGETCVAGRCR